MASVGPFPRVPRRNGPARVPRQAAVRPPRPEGVRRQGRHDRRGRRRRGERDRLPGRRQGPGADRRPRQGRRREARRRRGRGARARGEHPRHGHPRAHRAHAVDRARLRHRDRVLRLGAARPLGQAAARDVQRRGRRGHRRGRREDAREADPPPRRRARGALARGGRADRHRRQGRRRRDRGRRRRARGAV